MVYLYCGILYDGASLVAQTVKNLPPVRETRVQSLGQEDSPGERNGQPLDREAWWATVHGVAKRRTRLSTQHGTIT